MTTETDLRKGFTLGQWEVLPDWGLLRDGKNREHSDFQRLFDSTGLIAYWSQAGCAWASDRGRCENL